MDEALLGTLGEVRTALEDVLERTGRSRGWRTETALGESEGGDTTASSQMIAPREVDSQK